MIKRYGASVSLQYSSYNVKVVCVSNVLSLWCFYRESLWLWRFLLVVWHYVAICCVGCVCARQSENLFVWFGAKPKQKAWAPDLPRDQKWTRRGRDQRRHRISWQRKMERGSRQRRAEETKQEKIEAGQRRESERRLLRPDDLHRGWVNQRENMLALIVTFIIVSRKIHVCDSLQMHGEIKVSQNSLSCTWNWLKTILFVCSFSPTLSVVFFVAIKKYEIPQWKPLDESLAMNSIGLKKLISQGPAAEVVSHLAPCTRIKVNLRKIKRNHDGQKWFRKGKEKGSREWMGQRMNELKKMPKKDHASSKKRKKKRKNKR